LIAAIWIYDIEAAIDSISLNTFLAIARQGTVTAAARELHTVQSNVTARLKQLEGELEVALFVRHSRGMALTPAGSRLVAYAQRFNALSAEAVGAVRGDGHLRGALRLGSMETTAAVRLPALLGRLHREHPDVQIEVRSGTTAELLDQVLTGRLDGAFVAGPVRNTALKARPAFREELVLVAARDGDSMPARLARGTLTVIAFRSGCSYRQRLETHFANAGWLPYQRIEFGTVEGILGCVAADLGVTLLPRALIEAHGSRKAFSIERLGRAGLFVDTLFVRRADAPPGPAMRALAEGFSGARG
jgi:DNA-binding transcriptional LysR family regulator